MRTRKEYEVSIEIGNGDCVTLNLKDKESFLKLLNSNNFIDGTIYTFHYNNDGRYVGLVSHYFCSNGSEIKRIVTSKQIVRVAL